MPTTRLSEVWLEQKFANGKASIRVGQLAADAEFFYSELSTMFLQSDWPTIAAVNLPSGGAGLPAVDAGSAASRSILTSDVSLLLAVFNGDPAGPGSRATSSSATATASISGSATRRSCIGEAQFRRNTGNQDTGLATTLKLGGWRHFGQFDNRRFASEERPDRNELRAPTRFTEAISASTQSSTSSSIVRPAAIAQSGISVFSRMSLSPSDRNLINAYIDGGIVFAGLIPSRPKDRFGAGVIHARFSEQRPFDRSGHVGLHRSAGAPRPRDQSRAQLPGPDRAGLDRAAEPAIRLASARRPRHQNRDRGGRARRSGGIKHRASALSTQFLIGTYI